MLFINHSERSSVPKISQKLYCKVWNSSRESTMNDRESAMATVITCHNRKREGHKKTNCNRLKKKSDKLSNLENGKRKWHSHHHSDGDKNEGCYQQQSELANLDNKKRWCTYHNIPSHSKDECFHQRGCKFENSSSVDSKRSREKKLPLLIVPLLATIKKKL